MKSGVKEQATLRKSIVNRRLKNAGKTMVPGFDRMDVVAAAEQIRSQPLPHIPSVPGVSFVHRLGSARCAPDHPMWTDDVPAAIKRATAIVQARDPSRNVSEHDVLDELAKDPRYPEWMETEQSCVERALSPSRAPKKEARSSPRQELRRRTQQFLASGGDRTSAAYFDDVLEPEQRLGFFYRQWVKSGRSPTSHWYGLWQAEKQRRKEKQHSVLRVGARRKTSPAVRMAAKTARSPKKNPTAGPRLEFELRDPGSITPPHHVNRPAHLEALAEAMRRGGWMGRPILVEDGGSAGMQAWTGSHRIAAAMRAGVPVPIVRIPGSVFARAGLRKARTGFYFHSIPANNRARHSIAQRCGCGAAEALMRAELKADASRSAQ